MTEITFSERFGYIDKGSDDGVLARSQVFLAASSFIGYVPWLAKIHDILIPICGHWLGHTARAITFRALAQKKTHERRHRTDVHGDIFSYLNEVRSKKPDEFSDSDLISMLTTNIFAGSDTTATALRAMVWYLLKTPSVSNRFLEEMEKLRRGNKLSNPVQYSEAEVWPYLQAVMYEAMRLHAPFGNHLPRSVPKGGLVVKGQIPPPRRG